MAQLGPLWSFRKFIRSWEHALSASKMKQIIWIGKVAFIFYLMKVIICYVLLGIAIIIFLLFDYVKQSIIHDLPAFQGNSFSMYVLVNIAHFSFFILNYILFYCKELVKIIVLMWILIFDIISEKRRCYCQNQEGIHECFCFHLFQNDRKVHSIIRTP